MTARAFIDQIFSRRQDGVASNLRYLSPAQLELLRKLVEADAIGELRPGIYGSFVWLLDGEHFVVSQDAAGRRRTILWLKVQQRAASLF
ncbi:MAG TPA: hypothetical protein VKB47_17980 [Terracidiphilus sp.]|nr:hypothetical protein [Terracidiphilus sp.]